MRMDPAQDQPRTEGIGQGVVLMNHETELKILEMQFIAVKEILKSEVIFAAPELRVIIYEDLRMLEKKMDFILMRMESISTVCSKEASE